VSSYLAGYRGETVRAYTGDLKSWTHWCASAGVNPVAATRAHIEAYARYLEDARDLAPATVARRITTVCGFYRHCTAEGVIDRDPGQFVSRPHDYVPRQREEAITIGLHQPLERLGDWRRRRQVLQQRKIHIDVVP